MTELTAGIVRIGTERVYRCDTCRALLVDAEDARAHLWWHEELCRLAATVAALVAAR